jgi:zinc protease
MVFGMVSTSYAINVVQIETKKGIKIWFVEEKKSDIVAINAAFKNSGRVQDSDSKLGLSSFATALMKQGTESLDYKTLIRKQEELSIKSLNVEADTDHISVGIMTLSRTKTQACNLLKEILMRPRFDPIQMRTLKDQTIARLQEEERNPGSVATRAGQEILFKDHPYRRRNQGTIETIQNITKNDLDNFVKTRFSRDRLVVGVCGNLSRDEVIDLVDQMFGDLPLKSSLPEIARPQLNITGQTKEIPWDIPQTIIKFADQGISPKDPDIYAASILFNLLGSGFEGRLMREVRVKRGLTYGIGVAPLSMELADILMGGLSASTKNTPEAIKVIKEIWKDLRENGATQEEVDKSKDALMNAYVLGFAQTTQIAGQLVNAQILDRSPDYFDKRNDLMKAVTLDDVKRVAQKVLNPDKLSFIIVGKNK